MPPTDPDTSTPNQTGQKAAGRAPIRLVHVLLSLDGAMSGDRTDQGETEPQWLSTESKAPIPFNEVVPSWNLRPAVHHGYAVSLRLGRGMPVSWSPWFELGPAGQVAASSPALAEYGELKTDYIVCRVACTHLQARVRFTPSPNKNGAVGVDRFHACVTNTTGDKHVLKSLRVKPRRADSAAFVGRLAVPFITQHVAVEAMKGNICSPTSVAMVLGYHGLAATAEEVATAAFDPRSRIFGNWPLNVQAAYERGLAGCVTRMASWDDVELTIAAGQPIVASIRDPKGRLQGTPYGHTTGHLLVICGFDKDGNILANDPAGRDTERGQLTYDRAQFEQAWLRQGGFAYVFGPAARRPTDLR